MDAAVWDVTVFTKNRDRLLAGEIARGFLLAVLVDPAVAPLLSGEHFSVDGTLILGNTCRHLRFGVTFRRKQCVS
jgi:hypothetical protein